MPTFVSVMISRKNIPAGVRKKPFHNRGLLLLMIIPILVITGFQAWWLRENFIREKKNLDWLTGLTFRETVRKLQTRKLDLGKIIDDTIISFKNKKRGGVYSFSSHPDPGELTGVLNEITVRLKDSVKRARVVATSKDIFISGRANQLSGDSFTVHRPGKLVITMDERDNTGKMDSVREINVQHTGRKGEIFRFLYNVDSLQDSLRVAEIDSACRIAFKKEFLPAAFSISKKEEDTGRVSGHPDIPENQSRVTIGFTRPVTYEIQTAGSWAYLVKKLASPILFSLFLVGVTVLSFALLYRNLMKQRRLTEIKNEFISNITHELKTPIATVGVAIEALRNFNAINDPQRTREYLDISQNELHRLSLLVDKVLKLSMFENKEIELKTEPVDLKAIVEEVVSSMRLQIEKYHARVSVHSEGDTGLRADRLHLLSVVFNLLDNALKYSKGNTEVKFEIREKENAVELVVADNGIGIAPGYKDRIFEKFFRVPAGDTHNTKGYGLGLSYTAHVVKKHDGIITVDSQPGLGTKFTITLPKKN